MEENRKASFFESNIWTRIIQILISGILAFCLMLPFIVGCTPFDNNKMQTEIVPSFFEAPLEIGGYLFAHMTSDDYGRLYYSVSSDGLKWEMLNNAQRIDSTYKGHTDICKGHDGKYYLTGNPEDKGFIRIWISEDLINWSIFKDYDPQHQDFFPDFIPSSSWMGVPKMFFDEPTQTYCITWHATTHKTKHDFVAYWNGMRTFCISTKDLKTFSEPKKLFKDDLATIDVIIRRVGDTYYAIFKDEKFPNHDWITGKSVRIANSKTLTGCYTNLSDEISPNFHETPTLIANPDKGQWYIYFEQYRGC